MDPEIQAMQQIVQLLHPLSPDARERVISWAVTRFGASPLVDQPPPSAKAPSPVSKLEDFPGFADLFHAAKPASGKERALVGAIWVSAREGMEAFPSQAVQALLKHLGFKLTNVTDSLSQCMREKPAWIIQTRKSGSSQQARKTYKVTDAGFRHLSEMLDRSLSS